MNPELPFDAVILDMDGVVTDTRNLHYKAWKETFDELLSAEGRSDLFETEDYERFVDGKTREDGVRSFLADRNLELSGERVKELARKKNGLYLQKLRSEGPVVYEDAVRSLHRWKEEGIPLAVVSSSRNCTEVLELAGIRDVFDVQVDSLFAEGSHLRGKPEADYFIEAAERLGKAPQDCAIVEDSVAGIKAGVKGHFKEVIGMSREGQTPPEVLYREGASLVVSSLENIGKKQNAIRAWEEIKQRVQDREVALFLDFDGTLSEIVPHPSMARVRESALPVLGCCAKSLKMAVVSGRDRQDVKKLMNVSDLFYAGCHGFDISGPGGFRYEVEEASSFLPDIQRIRSELPRFLKSFPDAEEEDKKYFTALHYRNLDPKLEAKFLSELRSFINDHPRLELREGKKVVEIAPKLPWNKGSAVKKLTEVLGLDRERAMPIYIGDDLTDEDAFQELKGKGLGIKVGEENLSSSWADYWLADPAEVEEFLQHICKDFTSKEKRWRPGA